MKTVLVLSFICAIAGAAPSISLVGSPLIASQLVATHSLARASPWVAPAAPWIAPAAPLIAPLAPVATPLLAEVGGEAPASTVHAKHVKQVVVPQVVTYSLPAPAPPQLITTYSVPASAPAVHASASVLTYQFASNLPSTNPYTLHI